MRALPLEIGVIHFVGIGGIGMSGIAEVMHNLGYQVQGSDISESPTVERLRKRGMKVAIGHARENVEGVAVVVTSTAVKRSNPEVEAALEALVVVLLEELLLEGDGWQARADHGDCLQRVAWVVDALGEYPTRDGQ